MTPSKPNYPFLFCLITLLSTGCTSREPGTDSPFPEPLFTRLSPVQTGIEFSNTLLEHPSPHRTELLYEYFSNGGGVAVGDVNGDGLEDLYFSGNMTYNRLYLNRGDLTFEDVTDAAGVAGRKNTWKTGVTMADVDGDGRLDLYVCYSGDLPLERRIDQLFINQGADAGGIPRFEDQTETYGLANPHASNQGYFFDYDRDNDLDLFLLTHNVKQAPHMDPEATRAELQKDDPIHGVRLYNQRDGRFVDVTRGAGLSSSSLTFGLGAGLSDVDRDGWIDLYVGNDYSPPDYLYMNNGDGTFTDELANRIRHTSNASMGVDVADINNDGWVDIMVLDMLSPDRERQHTLVIPNDRELFETIVQSGFHHQYMRNMLQLNNGNGAFSEIGQLAGVSHTDWSWAPLIADYDNDGWKDIFVTNGILHDALDRDFLAFKNNYVRSRGQQLDPGDIAYLIEQLPSSDLTNVAFRNVGGLQFEDASSAWGLGAPLKSTGAAYADLDRDGDLDLITNNINEPAYVFENHSREVTPHAYVQIDLRGDGSNTAGAGAGVTVYAGGLHQYAEQMPARGYLSSVSPILHFGLGRGDVVDSLRVRWPDGRVQTLTGVAANQRLVVRQEEAVSTKDRLPPTEPLIEAIPSPIDFHHRMAGPIDDFRRQPLMDHPKSFEGPPLVAADVNGDGRLDVFAGGGNGQASQLFLQQPDGSFVLIPQPAFDADHTRQDVDALFLDADQDGYLDLYVASGGYGRFSPEDEVLQDRLYMNDGRGLFTRSEYALPPMPTSTGAVTTTDINADGWPDLYVGGYVVPGRYPESPRSYLLVNDGQGRFEDRTDQIASELMHIGMVNDARWHDLDADGKDELIVVGSWMPVSIFELSAGVLNNATNRYFDTPYAGLWNTVLVEDLNGDGRADLLAGNLGVNTQLAASVDQPALLYHADFDNNGTVDPILTFFVEETRYPFVTLDELRHQIPLLASRYPSYAAYAGATIDDFFSAEQLANARQLEATHLETSLFVGQEGGVFEKKELPIEAQFAPVFAIHARDVDADGHLDLILSGNIHEGRILLGQYDAGYGVLLKGMGNASFESIPPYRSGLNLQGDVRSILEINGRLLFGTNRNPLQAYKPASEWQGNYPSP